MKDPTEKVFEAIYNTLNGNVIADGIEYPVYSVVPDSVERGYVFVDQLNRNNADTKTAFMTTGTLQVQVMLPTVGTNGSRKTFERVCSKVQELIEPQVNTKLDLGSNFNNTYLYNQGTQDLSNEPLETGRYFRKIITYFLEIEQL